MSYVIENNDDSPLGAKVIHFEDLMQDSNNGEQPRFYNISKMTDVFMDAMAELGSQDDAIIEAFREKQADYKKDSM